MVPDECWVVETSTDGTRWRAFGKAWKQPGEPVLLHAAPTFVRYRPVGQDEWHYAPERLDDHPMTLLVLEEGTRRELWPGEEHVGLPVLLPGGEEGRLLRFDHAEGPTRWTYALEFRGSRDRG